MTDYREDVPHEYGPSTVGHGESQCVWCRGTNREIAIISPNHCKQRAQAISEATESVEAGVLAMDMVEVTQADNRWRCHNCQTVSISQICPKRCFECQHPDFAPAAPANSTADLQAKLGAAVAVLSEVDDTLEKLSGSLAELDAALFAQEIAVIAQDRESIAAIKGPSHE